MEIRGIRYGYSGDGLACGPVEGDTIVELKVLDDGALYFITDSRMSEFESVYVSPLSIFDILIDVTSAYVDFEKEYQKVKSVSTERYSYEYGKSEDDPKSSRFAKAIHLARLAMQTYYLQTDQDDDSAIKEFMEAYLDQDVDDIDLPELKNEFEDEFEEEEE